MPYCMGYHACITVGGVKLEEFSVEAEEGDLQASCWIPAEPGQEFTVRIIRFWKYRNIDWGANLVVDGRPSTGITRGSDQMDGCINAEAGVDQHGLPCWRSFVFTARDLVEDTGDKALKSTAAGTAPGCKLGQLVVTVREGQLVARPSTHTVPRVYAPSVVASSEQLAKALDTGVSPGRKLPNVMTSNSYLKDSVKVAVFVFEYRSLEVLRAFGRAPQLQRAPTPDLDDNDNEDLDAVIEREERLLTQLKRRRLEGAKRSTIKQQVARQAKHTEAILSRRRSSNAVINAQVRKKQQRKNFIDLTLDD